MVEDHVDKIRVKYNGMSAGDEHGKRGHFMTFVVCYLRDVFSNFRVVTDAAETSCTWSDVSQVLSSYNKACEDGYEKFGFPKRCVYNSWRLT